ncbi:hypothetical protein PHOSAC3_120566 [Mesotoga infera]|nr:hypothetical protein PHOSAC3_120566 [Mesotoga infera]
MGAENAAVLLAVVTPASFVGMSPRDKQKDEISELFSGRIIGIMLFSVLTTLEVHEERFVLWPLVACFHREF